MIPTPRTLRFASVALGILLAASTAGAQTNVADYNLNPASKAFARDSGAYQGRPSGPINGNTNPYYDYAGNFHHSSGGGDWWFVDLGATYDISRLVFYYRLDCCYTQNDGDVLSIWTSTPDFNNPANAVFTATLNFHNTATDDYSFSPITGRFVSVSGVANNGIIVFPELQVFAVPTAAVPEPASMVLVATGLLGVFAAGRRKRN